MNIHFNRLKGAI